MPLYSTWEWIRSEYRQREPLFISDQSGTPYYCQYNYFLLSYLGVKYRVSFPEGSIKREKEELPAASGLSPEEEILFLQYLCWARGLPPQEKWKSFLELPGGEHHNLPFQKEAIYPLARQYGEHISCFCHRGEQYGRRIQLGDAAFLLPVFPLINLAVVLWQGDEEFAPRANVLFDSASPYHLPTASLYVLGIAVVRRIWEVEPTL